MLTHIKRNGHQKETENWKLFIVPSHAVRSSVNLKILKVKNNFECLRVFLIGTNNYYRCNQTVPSIPASREVVQKYLI